MKVVIDCNVFVMAVSSKSPYHKIVSSLQKGVYKLYVSTEIYFEIAEKIEEKFRNAAADAFLDALYVSPDVISAEPTYRWNLICSRCRW